MARLFCHVYGCYQPASSHAVRGMSDGGPETYDSSRSSSSNNSININNNTMGQRETNGLIVTIPDTCAESHISSAAYTTGTAT